MKYFIFTTKHHDGFSMFDTKTKVNAIRRAPKDRVPGLGNYEECEIAYSIMDTRFKRDIVKEIVTAFRARGLGVGLYYSNTDWNDKNQRFEPLNYFYDPAYTPESDPEGYRKAIERQTTQLRELCSRYGEILQFGFDHGLPESLWPETVKMIKMVRRLQPNALFRHRGLGPYGDYETPEHWVPESPDDPRLSKPWQAIEHFGTRWAWQPNDTYHSKEWVLETLIDCASKGGNFMVGISPMANGKFDDYTVNSLKWVGKWLRINGEAIYGSRGKFIESDAFRFTKSKDDTYVYAIHKGWPGNNVTIKNIRPVKRSSVYMLGVVKPLEWKQKGKNVLIEIPDQLADNKPCEHSFVFKIKVN